MLFFFFKQKTAYDMRISDWSSDVCSSDLAYGHPPQLVPARCARSEQLVRQTVIIGEHPAILMPQRNDHRTRERGEIDDLHRVIQIGRASCRERVCQYV